MGQDGDKLSRFLRNTFILQHKEGRCFRLTLKHIVPKGPGGDVANYPIGDGEITPHFLEELQDKISTDADVDAEGNGGVQKYQLLAYHEGSPDHSLSRLVFRSGDPANEEHDFDTEPANERGLLAQQMRHNEALIRSQVTSTNNVMQILSRQNEKLQNEKEALESDRFRNLEMMEKLMSHGHERYLAEQQADFEMKMKKDIGQKLMMLAPAVINKLAGKTVMPEVMRPQDVMLKNFAESITPEQYAHLMQIFKPEQQVVLAQVMAATQPPQEEDGNDGKAS